MLFNTIDPKFRQNNGKNQNLLSRIDAFDTTRPIIDHCGFDPAPQHTIALVVVLRIQFIFVHRSKNYVHTKGSDKGTLNSFACDPDRGGSNRPARFQHHRAVPAWARRCVCNLIAYGSVHPVSIACQDGCHAIAGRSPVRLCRTGVRHRSVLSQGFGKSAQGTDVRGPASRRTAPG